MPKYVVATFIPAQEQIDAITAIDQQYELVGIASFNDVGEAYEKLIEIREDGKKPLILSEQAIVEMVGKLRAK